MGKIGVSLLSFVLFVRPSLQVNISSTSDDQFVNEYLDRNVGIAITMVSTASWQNPGGGAPGVNHMDRAVFFSEPQSTYQHDAQQAMTITNSGLGMAPYLGAGPYGLGFHIGKEHNFWQFFQQNGAGQMCGLPHDGFKCGALPSWRLNILNRDYDWFRSQVNDILGQYHGHYNEFDVNGLSSSALAGVVYWKKAGFPNDWWQGVMCGLLKYANPGSDTAWPVYELDWQSLSLQGHLECGSVSRSAPTLGHNDSAAKIQDPKPASPSVLV
mmetsp:Transcript_79996/g.138849  ORF Transcript_79996/g.138849 Transcript_79996/m.138849 type:complete len:269 (-) Transcript_79996:75-881(-)